MGQHSMLICKQGVNHRTEFFYAWIGAGEPIPI